MEKKALMIRRLLERLLYVPVTVFIINVRYFQSFPELFNTSLTQFFLRLNGKQVLREQDEDVFIFLSYFCSGGRRNFPTFWIKKDHTFPSTIVSQQPRNHPSFFPSLTPSFQTTLHPVLVVLLPKYTLNVTASHHHHSYPSCPARTTVIKSVLECIQQLTTEESTRVALTQRFICLS